MKFYRPSSRHVKGFSSGRAALKAISAPQFKGAPGAYVFSEQAALAKAIIREYRQA